MSVPGASKFLLEGLTCYSNEAKENILGVNRETIRLYGAVSEQTASEMLDGLQKLSGADYLVVTTGNAGPTAEKQNEVGVCYIGVLCGETKKIQKFRFEGNRNKVIEDGTCAALSGLYSMIINKTNQ